MPAFAPLEQIQEAVSEVRNLNLTPEQIKVLIKYGVMIGWKNMGKILKDWNAEEIKSGKKNTKSVVQVRKPIKKRGK